MNDTYTVTIVKIYAADPIPGIIIIKRCMNLNKSLILHSHTLQCVL